MSPRLSVVIPVKNGLRYLPTAISSVRRQQLDEVEIIVVDDQSTDGLDKWLEQEVKKDPRLKPQRGPGAGVAAARNVGLRACNADLVAFLDADDSWNDNVIAERIALMNEHPGISLAFADHESYSIDGKTLGTHFAYFPRFHRWVGSRSGLLPLGPQAFNLLFAENVCGTSTVIARRSALEAAGGFDPNLKICEDWDMWLKLSRTGEVWCSTALASRFLHRADSTSRNSTLLLASLAEVTARHAPYADRRTRAIARARVAAAKADVAEEAGRLPQAVLHRLSSVVTDPTKRAAWELLGTSYRLLSGQRSAGPAPA
jgi:glycosyltransferase involved in cell wall biosynthesis